MTAVRDEVRCTYVYVDSEKNRERNRVGTRCSQPRVNGTDRCKFHGGNSPNKIAADRAIRIENETRSNLDKFTDLWDEKHPLLDPFSLMLWEIRRSAARIEWFDARMRELTEEKELWWGLVKEEDLEASEFPGRNKTYEARENVILKMQNAERDRLNRLTKEWADHRFEALKIAGYGAFGQAMRRTIKALCEEFGLDMSDHEVRDRIRRVLGEQPNPLPDSIEPPKRGRR